MKFLAIMMVLYLNMISSVQLGAVPLDNVNSFKITEDINAISNTAEIVIPHNYEKLDGKHILEQIKVGDPVLIRSGYYAGTYLNMADEFVGYIREIESEMPIKIHCDDESYILQQTNYVKSYPNAKLKDVLTDIIPKSIKVECPDVTLGDFQIDNQSAFTVLNTLKEEYGIYSKLRNGVLKVNLRDLIDVNEKENVHTYTLNPGVAEGSIIKKSELKYKRKEDFQLRVKATAMQDYTKKNGKAGVKKFSVEVGSKQHNASQINVTYPGKVSEKDLQEFATSIYNKRCYDGFTGSITGFGLPRTHAGDSLVINSNTDNEKKGKYLIEKVEISYDESSAYSRKNELSYRLS
ncbi:hypothetical protein LJC16_00720 [Bacteroidales bacterium OttesenSCG-928-C19]|nr:hypothetical protein [Bacteroidales bacterium OttesenSCG-928-C19]